MLENNDSTIKDAMKRLEKQKKADEIKAYINPEIAEAHKTKGTALFKEGNFPGAIKEYDEGMRRDPKNTAILCNRAQAYIKLIEPNQGIKDADKALEIDKTIVKAWLRKATCHQMMKEYHKALEAFDKGLELDPSNKDLSEGKIKTARLVQMTSHASSGNDEERVQKAMADPEIQMIMRDPTV